MNHVYIISWSSMDNTHGIEGVWLEDSAAQSEVERLERVEPDYTYRLEKHEVKQ